MKIIEPKVELWQQGGDAKVHVARCARVCYGRETGNDQATIKRLIVSPNNIAEKSTRYVCDWDIISPLKFTDDEWCQISSDGTCQNRRIGYLNPYYRSAYNVSKCRK